MPELPEVEVTRRSVVNRITGATVLSVRMGKPLRWPLGVPTERLIGCKVEGVRRRGKYLLLDLSGPSGLLLVHLGMSGSLAFLGEAPPDAGMHDHFDLVTDRGVLRLHDPRRFGAVVYAGDEAAPSAAQLLGRLGAEPLSDTWRAADFHAGLRRRNASIKQVLLMGDLVVGVGNIYASEALFAAGIRPTTRASRVGAARAERLHGAIRAVLARAVVRGGSTLRDFSAADGQEGHFQQEAMVYGREGQPCRTCGTPIRRLVQGQRATYWCVVCQH